MKITKKILENIIMEEVNQSLQEAGMSNAAMKSSDASAVPTDRVYKAKEIDKLLSGKSRKDKLDWLESRYMPSSTSPCRAELKKKNAILKKNCKQLRDKAASIRNVDSSMLSEFRITRKNIQNLIEQEVYNIMKKQKPINEKIKISRKRLEKLILEEISCMLEQQTLKLGPEFGPEGQLKARLAAKDPEELNKLANRISSGVRYMLEYPQSGKGDQNIEYTLKAVKALEQYIEFRLLGLLDPDRPVQGGSSGKSKSATDIKIDTGTSMDTIKNMTKQLAGSALP